MRFDILFLDIGGVLLTNGWDHTEREKAALHFGFDWKDFEQRHLQYYNLHETGQLSLEEYLQKTIFWKERSYSLKQFQDYMAAQSKPFPEMLQLMRELKQKYKLRIAAISNEGKELTDYRIQTFHLTDFIDDFFMSCFVGMQKPDANFYLLALNVMQVTPERVIYLDDRPQLVSAGTEVGIYGLTHKDYQSTKERLYELLAQ